jgi:hypothetical protein
MTPSQIIENFEMGGYSTSMTLESYTRQYCDVPMVIRDIAVAQYEAAADASLEAYRTQLKVENAQRQAWLKTPEGIAFTEKETAKVAKLTAAIQANKRAIAELMTQAKTQAATMGEITEEDIDDWRVANGYLWKVVSPKGRVYTEVLKQVTIKTPDDYVKFNAMKIAFRNTTGLNY